MDVMTIIQSTHRQTHIQTHRFTTHNTTIHYRQQHKHTVPSVVDLEEAVMVVAAASDADPAVEVGVAVVVAAVVD